jgi:septal ring factor EnvC (AmiA/AmiB activator)
MCKKIVIAGLAVAVGVAVLAFVSPKLFSLIMYTGQQVQQGIDESIPPETELGRISNEVDQAVKEQKELFQRIAVQEQKLKHLDEQVAVAKKELTPLEDRVDLLAANLEKDRVATKVSDSNGHSKPREQVVAELKTALETRDAKRNELQATQDLHDQSQTLLDQLNKQRLESKATVEKMRARLKEVEVKIAKARAAEAAAPIDTAANDRLSTASKDLEKLSDRVDIMARVADLQSSSTPKPTTADQPTEDDLLKRAHGNVDPGKTTVADKP